MARPRSALYRALPPNLVFDICNGQYRYRRIDNNTFHWMGRDKNKAINAAKQLNSLFMIGQDLVTKVTGQTQTLQHYIENDFITKHLPTRGLAEETLSTYNNQLIKIKNKLGKLPINTITVRDIASFLEPLTPVPYNHYRSLLSLIFKYAIADGYADDNPSEKTIKKRITKQRRRLTFDKFLVIRNYKSTDKESSDNLWFRNAMDLALLTLQRREDIVKMKFSDIKNENGVDYLYVIQKKTQKHGESAFIKMKIDGDLKKVIERCRDNIPSSYLIHRQPKRRIKAKSRDDNTQVLKDFLTSYFSNVRDELGLFNDMPVLQRPTFHEIRSLGIKLYENAGSDAQKLAGHTSREMTERYKAGHEITWTEANANLCLENLNQ